MQATTSATVCTSMAGTDAWKNIRRYHKAVIDHPEKPLALGIAGRHIQLLEGHKHSNFKNLVRTTLTPPASTKDVEILVIGSLLSLEKDTDYLNRKILVGEKSDKKIKMITAVAKQIYRSCDEQYAAALGEALEKYIKLSPLKV